MDGATAAPVKMKPSRHLNGAPQKQSELSTVADIENALSDGIGGVPHSKLHEHAVSAWCQALASQGCESPSAKTSPRRSPQKARRQLQHQQREAPDQRTPAEKLGPASESPAVSAWYRDLASQGCTSLNSSTSPRQLPRKTCSGLFQQQECLAEGKVAESLGTVGEALAHSPAASVWGQDLSSQDCTSSSRSVSPRRSPRRGHSPRRLRHRRAVIPGHRGGEVGFVPPANSSPQRTRHASLPTSPSPLRACHA